MTNRPQLMKTTLSLIAAIVLSSSAIAQTDRALSSSSSPTCGQACSETQMRSTASSSSRSLQASPDDVSSLSSASQSNDQEQIRSILQKHGFSSAQLEGFTIVVNEVKSPRDAASGLATGKRQHKPMVSPDGSSSTGGAEPAPASKVTVTITVKLKPPTIIITIRW
jgi:hypothetical protein